MQHEARAGDDPVAALLLHTRQPAEHLVGHVLAQALLAEATTRQLEELLDVGEFELELEPGITAEVADALRSRGHEPVYFTPEENAERRRGLD